jgi:hypothetical protein
VWLGGLLWVAGAERWVGCVAAALQGNPLLDISAVVPAEMLTKYDVKPNDAVLAGAANGGTDKQLEVYAVRVHLGAVTRAATCQ